MRDKSCFVRNSSSIVSGGSFSSDSSDGTAEIRILAFLSADCSMIVPMHAAAASDPAVGGVMVCSSVQGTCECDSPISEVRQVWSPV